MSFDDKVDEGCEHGFLAVCPDCIGLTAALARAESAEKALALAAREREITCLEYDKALAEERVKRNQAEAERAALLDASRLLRADYDEMRAKVAALEAKCAVMQEVVQDVSEWSCKCAEE